MVKQSEGYQTFSGSGMVTKSLSSSLGVDISGFEDFGCLDFDFFRRFRVPSFFSILWSSDSSDSVRESVHK